MTIIFTLGQQDNCFGINLKQTFSYTAEFTAYYYADEDGYHDVSISVGGGVEVAIYFGNGGFECCDHDDTSVGKGSDCIFGSWWKSKRGLNPSSSVYLKKGFYYPVRVVCNNKKNQAIPSFNVKCPSGKHADMNKCLHHIPDNTKHKCTKTTITCLTSTIPKTTATPKPVTTPTKPVVTPTKPVVTPTKPVVTPTKPVVTPKISCAPKTSTTPKTSSAPASSAPASSAPASSAPASSAPASSAPASSAPASSAPASSAPASSAPG
ncbi:unnamed protein product [[Candida] boidinii]|nr:unnamed protein product [[Candida] boidinii]